MPIKVRCQDCETVLKLSDKAAGRAVKCKACGARVKVPGKRTDGDASGGGQAGTSGRKKRKRRPPSEAPAVNRDDIFGQVDLRRAESNVQICPSCTHEITDEEAFMCPKCGVDLDTGKLSSSEAKRRARQGPPPEEFYGAIWGNAWTFVMDHKGFVVRTGITWSVSFAMVVLAAFTINWYVPQREIALEESMEGAVTENADGVWIQPTKQDKAKYDGTTYNWDSSIIVANNGNLRLPTRRIAAITSPPALFWYFILSVFFLGMTGWAWTLSAKIVEVTLAKKKKIKRFQGDLFGDMTGGFKTIFWPVMIMYPLVWIPGVMYATGATPLACAITGGVIFLLPYVLFLPLAVVHMAQPFTYRGWLTSWTCKDFLSTIGPSLYVSMLFFVLVLLPPLGIAGGVAAMWDRVADFYFNSMEVPLLGISTETADQTYVFSLFRMPFFFFTALFTGMIFFSLLAIPTVFMMRVFGLFGLYFRPDMSLCVEEVEFTDVSFGPRFLAFHVDAIVIAIILAANLGAASGISWLFGFIYGSKTVGHYIFIGTTIVGTIGLMALYFGKGESGAGRCTLGKWSLGLIVLKEDNDPMKFDLAVKRFFASLLSVVTLSGTFTMCLFTPHYRALHDTMTKTKVVWRSDEE